MSIAKETTFVDAVTVVLAAWLNLVQEHIAGLVTLVVDTPTATQVRVFATAAEPSSVYIGGQQRRRETAAAFNFISEGAATYNMYVTAPAGVDTFELEVTNGTPTVSPYRLIGTVIWNGASIDGFRMDRGRGQTHDHSALAGAGQVAHSALLNLTAGDPHTELSKADAARAFTSPVAGVTPSSDLHLARKDYVDGLSAPGLPVGTIVPFGGSVLPGGWKWCDGASYDTTAEADLFAVLAYAYGGAASNFNVPDLRDRFALGKAAAGLGSGMGDTAGSLGHTHTQVTHTHAGVAHVHDGTAHVHTVPTTGTEPAHTHTQSVTGSAGLHAHTAAAHTHTGTSYTVGNTATAAVGSEHASEGSTGLFSYLTLAQNDDGTSHRHGVGTLKGPNTSDMQGVSSYASATHAHNPAGYSWEHTHAQGNLTGSIGSGGALATSSDGAHTHTNPATGSDGSHSHTYPNTSSVAPATYASGGGGASSADGDEVSGAADPPYLVTNYIVRSG